MDALNHNQPNDAPQHPDAESLQDIIARMSTNLDRYFPKSPQGSDDPHPAAPATNTAPPANIALYPLAVSDKPLGGLGQEHKENGLNKRGNGIVSHTSTGISSNAWQAFNQNTPDIQSSKPVEERDNGVNKRGNGDARLSIKSHMGFDGDEQQPSLTLDEQPNLPLVLPHVELPTNPEYIQSEAFLEVSGFFTPSSSRIKNIYIKEKKLREYTDEHGTKKILKTKISANHELGLPITSDLDYYRAFLKICDETVDRDGRFRLPIAVPSFKLARYAGKQWSDKARKEIREWLKRMTLTGVEGAIYRAKKKNYDDGFVGTVFSQVVMKGETMRNGTSADTNYVWLSPWFLSNYYYRYTRPIDFTFYKQLRKPIAKSLYTLLENGWYATGGKPYAKSYRVLCDEFLLTHHRYFSDIKQQLDPSHRELQALGFLAQWEYRKAATGSDYIITYYPGQKFFQDQKEKDTRRQLAEQLENDNHKSLPPQLDLVDRSKLLVSDILAACGDHENIAAYHKIIKDYPEPTIRMALSETKQAHLEGRILKTKGAYFTDTLKRLAQLREIRET